MACIPHAIVHTTKLIVVVIIVVIFIEVRIKRSVGAELVQTFRTLTAFDPSLVVSARMLTQHMETDQPHYVGVIKTGQIGHLADDLVAKPSFASLQLDCFDGVDTEIKTVADFDHSAEASLTNMLQLFKITVIP
jgi:hypothetical protein